MDPISGAIGIASGAVTLSGLALTIGKTLTSCVKTYQRSALIIYSLISACQGIEIAWNSIHTWVESQAGSDSVDDVLLNQLESAIEVGTILLTALRQDLDPYDSSQVLPPSISNWQKLKSVLDEDVFKDHCIRLNLQVSTLHLLLAATTLLVIYSSLTPCSPLTSL